VYPFSNIKLGVIMKPQNIRFTIDQWQKLTKIAKKKGLTFAAMVRISIDFYLKNNGK